MGFLEPNEIVAATGVARPFDHPHDGIPRFDYTCVYKYICMHVCMYTGRHGRLVPWEEIFGIARTF